MKFHIEKEDLLFAVSTVERAVSGKNTLPALGAILVEAKAGQVCFRATDLELAMETVVNAQVEEEGVAAAPGKRFAAICRLLPSGTVELSCQGQSLRVDYRGGSQNLPCYPAEEFPILPSREGELQGMIPAAAFRRLTRQVGIAASGEEVRPVFTGVYTELGPEEMVLVATDSHRLALGRGQWQGNGQRSLLIPNRTMQEVARLALGEETAIRFTAGKSQVFFEFANIAVTSRLIVGQYPDYRQVIPEEERYCSEVILSRQQFSEVLERAGLIARETGRGRGSVARLELGEEEIVISAEVPDEGRLQEALAAAVSGQRLVVNFNVRYLLDALKAIEEEQIRLRLTGSATPALILPVNDDPAISQDYLYLLLPVRMTR